MHLQLLLLLLATILEEGRQLQASRNNRREVLCPCKAIEWSIKGEAA